VALDIDELAATLRGLRSLELDVANPWCLPDDIFQNICDGRGDVASDHHHHGSNRMAILSAGILMYRRGDAGIVVLLAHPGGPFWRGRDLGAWSIPKGELDDAEDAEAAARREFQEELGVKATGPLHALGEVRQRAGKIVRAYALEGELDVSRVRSNQVAIEWPARSGRIINIPEIDRAAWFDMALARQKILASQEPLLDRLEMLLKNR
jgi:predicted NUDIX family NTP pyrophosphohydrolase